MFHLCNANTCTIFRAPDASHLHEYWFWPGLPGSQVRGELRETSIDDAEEVQACTQTVGRAGEIRPGSRYP